jgi:hypothetical protein
MTVKDAPTRNGRAKGKRSVGLNSEKDAVSLRPALAELERAFDAFAPLFKRPMPRPVITIQHRGRRRAVGWYWHDRWEDPATEKRPPEINLCAEHMASPPEEVAEVLLHEMCHYANALEGIKDCSKNHYHNKHFRDRCHSVGLNSEKMESRGWADTSLSPELLEKVKAVAIDPAAFAIYRRQEQGKKPGSKMKKWQCSAGCTITRCATVLDATCNRCGKRFVREDKKADQAEKK